MDLRPVPKDRLDEWRKKYRQHLALPVIPDFHEALCQLGKAYVLEEAGQEQGYVILTSDPVWPDLSPVIPEFYLGANQAKYARKLLREMIAKLEPATIVGRTDDAHGFPMLMDLRIPNQVAQSLYRLDREPAWAVDEDLAIVESRWEDALELLPLYAAATPEDGGIPDEMALTKSLALWRHYRLVAGDTVQAVCYVVPQFQRYITVSTIVLEPLRRKGLGRYLTAYAVRREIKEGNIFVAAGNSDNDAARGLLESMGANLTAHCLYFRP